MSSAATCRSFRMLRHLGSADVSDARLDRHDRRNAPAARSPRRAPRELRCAMVPTLPPRGRAIPAAITTFRVTSRSNLEAPT
jgi:hypothetical protein